MISKEEMYDFASLIAGISESELEVYKCGGKAKKSKKMLQGATMTPKDLGGNMLHYLDKATDAIPGVKLVKDYGKMLYRKTLSNFGIAPAFIPPEKDEYDPYYNERISVSQRADDGYKEDAYTTYIDGKRVRVSKIRERNPAGQVGDWVVVWENWPGENQPSFVVTPKDSNYNAFDRSARREYLKALDYDYKKSKGKTQSKRK